MKQRLPRYKKLPNAFLLSIILHAVLMAIWGAFQIQSQRVKEELYIQVEIASSPRKPAPRILKRPLHLSPVSNLLSPKSQQVMAENPELRLNLPQISSVPKLDLTVEQPLSMLTEDSIPLSAGSDSVGEISMLPSNSQFSRGKVETGNGFSIGNRSVRTPQSLGLELQTSPPEITSLTQPDVALLKIARNLLLTRTRDAIDIVFIIDASKSMRNDIDAVRKHLTQMTDLLKVKGLDFTVGVVTFRDGTTFPLLGWDFQVTPQTTSIQQIKETLNNISCRGGEKASNALVRAADKVKFRGNAERRFILVTDEYVSGSYSTKQVVTKMKSAKISVDVIGRAERFQEVLAEATGGIWLPISSLKE